MAPIRINTRTINRMVPKVTGPRRTWRLISVGAWPALLRTLTNTEARIRSAELVVGAQATVGEKPFERINFRGFDQIDVKACSVGGAAVLWPSIARQRHEE